MKLQLPRITRKAINKYKTEPRLSGRRGQAILELAILGSLLIMAFSIAISWSEKYNRQQSNMQQTFRATMKAAKEANNSANYGITEFRRMANMINPMELGQLRQFASSNQVLWSDGKKDAADQPTKAKAWYEFNGGAPIELPVPEGFPSGVQSTSSTFHSDANSATYFEKNEGGGSISTNKSQNSADTISASVDFAGGTASSADTLGPHGKYTGGGLSRGRGMQ